MTYYWSNFCDDSYDPNTFETFLTTKEHTKGKTMFPTIVIIEHEEKKK
jgi:hypothetical protein